VANFGIPAAAQQKPPPPSLESGLDKACMVAVAISALVGANVYRKFVMMGLTAVTCLTAVHYLSDFVTNLMRQMTHQQAENWIDQDRQLLTCSLIFGRATILEILTLPDGERTEANISFLLLNAIDPAPET
jgi:hypothetical protein